MHGCNMEKFPAASTRVIYKEQFRWKKLQQKRLPNADARLAEAVLYAVENELSLILFFKTFLYYGPSFLHCRLAREKES